MAGSSSTATTTTDAELIDRTRNGDTRAYGELWNRHSGAGRSIARRATQSFDADDLVSEAYVRVLKTIQRGGGPTTTFRPYLATAIRNLAATWHSRQTIQTVELDELPEIDERIDVTEQSDLVSHALDVFSLLPSRWKEALWLSEVEGLTAEEIGRAFSIAPGAAAALTFRARRGLKQAWAEANAA